MEKADDVIIVESSESIPSAEKSAENGGVVHEDSATVVDTNTGHDGDQDTITEAAEPSPAPQTPLKRKVSFPEDNCLVTRTYDPVDPWQNAGSVTREEVINSYKDVCSRLKIKPCDKLLKQLEEHEQYQDRIETIDLRDMKLDSKSCEALEEVFRRVRVKTLVLENANLEDEGAVALFEMIEFYQTAKKLNLAYNTKIKARGWQVCTRMLKKTPCIEYLDVRQTTWADQTIPLLGRALRVNCPLCVLHMENCNLSGRPLFMLANALKFNQILHDLFIGDNRLVSSDGTSLMSMLKCNGHLQLLDLRNNLLQDNGFGAICEGLSEQKNGPGLGTLVIWNNQLTMQSMNYLSNALMCTRNLHTINLGHNRVCNDGMQRLQPGLLRNHTLQRLGLLNTRIGSEGAVALAEFVADSKTILRLDLRENELHVAGLMAISLALKVNFSLVRIDLDKDMKKEQGMETTQHNILADIYNYCQRNKNQSLERKSFDRTESADSNPVQRKTSENAGHKQTNSSTHTKQSEHQGTFSGPVAKFLSSPFASRFKITRIWEHGSDSHRDAGKKSQIDIGPSGSEESSSDSQGSPDEGGPKSSDVNEFLEVSVVVTGNDNSENFTERIVDISTLEESINDSPVLDDISDEELPQSLEDSSEVQPAPSSPDVQDSVTPAENCESESSTSQAPDEEETGFVTVGDPVEVSESIRSEEADDKSSSSTNAVEIPVAKDSTTTESSLGVSGSPDDFEKELDAMLAGVHVDGSYKGHSVDDIVDEELWDHELEKLLKTDVPQDGVS